MNVREELFSAVVLLLLDAVSDGLEVHRPLDLVQVVSHLLGVDRLPELSRFFHHAKLAKNLKRRYHFVVRKPSI